MRADKIVELAKTNKKLKELLKKAKGIIDLNQNKYKASVDQQKELQTKLLEATDRNQDLLHTLEIFQAKRNGMSKDNVKEFVARVKVNDTGYTLIQSKDQEREWYKDSQILNLQEELSSQWKSCKQVNYDTIFNEQKKLED